MNLPKPIPKKYNELIADIEKGKIKIPQFQREFVWDIEKTAKLLDSILRGYPIGTFILWQTNERLRMISTLGSIVTRIPDDNETIDYVLDGQQRITSLFVALKGVVVNNIDYGEIYIDLDASEDEDIVVTDIEGVDDREYIRITEVIDFKFEELFRRFSNAHEKLTLIDKYRTNIQNYDFSTIQVSDVPIEIATDIFTRINVGGKPLTVFEIMCAKIFDKEKEFDLADKFAELKSELETKDFETVSESIPLQLASVIINKSCKRSNILSIPKFKFIDLWDDISNSIKAAIDYFRSFYCIQSSRLLPFDSLIVPFAYYFYKNDYKNPTGEHANYLRDMFWRYSLTQRYNNGTEGKIAHDVAIIEDILNGNKYKPAVSIEVTEKFIRENGVFKTTKSFIKAILCLLIMQHPRRLDSDGIVIVDNKHLLKGNSKNYHHFFPKAYLRKRGYEEDEINNIVNIILVDDYVNKYKIRDKAPAVYIEELANENNSIKASLQSHLIGDIDEYGITSNNYEEFSRRRATHIANLINQYIYPDIEISPDDIDDEEINNDVTAKETYGKFWEYLKNEVISKDIPLNVSNAGNSRILNIPIMTAKAYLRFNISIKNQTMAVELYFKDEGAYQKLMLQRNDFEDLIGKNVIWSDSISGSKKVSLEYGRKVNFYTKSNWAKYSEWLTDKGIKLNEVFQLFLEDIDDSKNYAQDVVNNPVVVYCKTRVGEASGKYLGKSIGFKVLKGSIVRLSTNAYGEAAQRKRNELIRKGIIKRVTEARGEFLDDYIFNTPSQASDVILGGSNNGWTLWKDIEGRTIDVLYRKKRG